MESPGSARRLCAALAATVIASAAMAMAPVPSPAPGSAAGAAPARGRFLVATQQVTGPYFARSVVLLLEYGPGGALGLVVNRETTLGLADLLPDLDVDLEVDREALRGRTDKVYLGGPVEPHSMLLLIRADAQPSKSSRVAGEVYLSASRETLRSLLDAPSPAPRFYAYVGHAGWAPGQLDAELARGDWAVAPARPELIFERDLSELWPRMIGEYGGLQVRAPDGLHPAGPRRKFARPAARRRHAPPSPVARPDL